MGWGSAAVAPEAHRLLGCPPQDRRGTDLFNAWFVSFHNDISRHGPNPKRAAHFLDPHRSPASMRDRYHGQELPDKEECLAELTGLVDQNVAFLSDRLELARAIAESERANARQRALTLRDEREARLMIRYQSEARLAFHRALDALMKSLKESGGDRSTDRGSKTEGQASPAEPVAHEKGPSESQEAAARGETRNEPKPAASANNERPSVVRNVAPPGPEAVAMLEQMFDSTYADSFRPAGGVDVLPMRVGRGPEETKKA
jgi:hypothetical protein